MATVHPSRLGLVPSEPSRRDSGRENRPSRSRSPVRDRRNKSPDGRGRRRDHSNDSRRRSRSREPRRNGERRASPAYDNYERPAPAPWREQDNMYPPRDGGHKGGWGGGGADFVESRRQQRLANTLSIWPPSPSRPEADRQDKKSKKSKRRRHSLSDSSDSSEDDRSHRRREKDKESKRKRHHKEKDREKEKSRSHRHKDKDQKRSSRRDKYASDSDDSDRGSRRKHRHKSRSQSVDKRIKDLDLDAKSKKSEEPPEADEDMWTEKAPAAPFIPVIPAVTHDEELEDDEIGPMPVAASGGKLSERDYGGALLRGEGSAMAAYLQDGDRIPRRGEIGLTSTEIETYEHVGYVMSGSRHRRMNAVRMRKENQVISAEEKRGILKMQREEREKRESMIIGGFKEILEDKLKSTGAR
ncbi:hypothetical protein RSAG8_04747, partial [Rhizoctonia solani AG-8 WAC10335]